MPLHLAIDHRARTVVATGSGVLRVEDLFGRSITPTQPSPIKGEGYLCHRDLAAMLPDAEPILVPPPLIPGQCGHGFPSPCMLQQ